MNSAAARHRGAAHVLPETPTTVAQAHAQQRLALVAQLCSDRVALVIGDADTQVIDVARSTASSVDVADGDPLAALSRAHDDGVSAVVWLEGPVTAGADEMLEQLASSDVRLLIGFPYAEREHRRSATVAHAREFAVRVGGLVLAHVLVDVAATLGLDAPASLDVVLGDVGPHADGYLVCAGLAPAALRPALTAAAVPSVRRRALSALEHANAELHLANARLGREHLGRHDSSAASNISSAHQRIAFLEERLAIEIKVAAQNDALFQEARRQLHEPHHRAAMRAREIVLRLPVLRLVFRLAWRLLR